MAETETADEVRSKYINVMGKDLGELYFGLYVEMILVHIKWQDCMELFGPKRNRSTLLNDVACRFFGMLKEMMWDDILLHIARMTDEQRSGGKSNLTICRIPRFVRDDTLRRRVERLINSAKSKCGFCRRWRNRRIAHRNLDMALGANTKPLEARRRSQVNEALSTIEEVLNIVHRHFMKSSLTFSYIESDRGARDLLYVIDDGLRVHKERLERLASGERRPDDWAPRDL